ncbi:hypothetical protein CUMW_156530 [Citrus unshiu]|uniref:Wall-associated receptor kinase galacturonan-binding domain-containing protein n=1 Tax=Citrus unshiu TaxID=55188 RepID=A0A2H5PPY2_CITUN|nr:hypothetical protein CUMW_156530 [Citrus unshiu]
MEIPYGGTHLICLGFTFYFTTLNTKFLISTFQAQFPHGFPVYKNPANMSKILTVTHVPGHNACPKCGSIEVPYPLSTNDNCGDPRYRVYCENDVLQLLSAGGFYYKIISINPSSYRLVISPPLIPKDTCYSSDLTSGGFTLDDDSPFNISTRISLSENVSPAHNPPVITQYSITQN